MASTCNYPRKERIYAGAFLFQKIRTQCPKSAIRTGCKVGGKSARPYLDNFTAAARGIPAATDSMSRYERTCCLMKCIAPTEKTPLWESVELYGLAVLHIPFFMGCENFKGGYLLMNECNKSKPRKECRHAETENGGCGHASVSAS